MLHTRTAPADVYGPRLGLIVQVHCENGPLIEALTAEALGSGRRGARVFADTRPPQVEEEAVARTLQSHR